MATMQVNGSRYESMQAVEWAIETFDFCKKVHRDSPQAAEQMGFNFVEGTRFVDNVNTNGEYKGLELIIPESQRLYIFYCTSQF